MANPIRNRQVQGNNIRDGGSIDNFTYNEKAGSRKTSEVGRSLLPLGDGAAAFTTDASTKRILPSAGLNLAVYNNSAAVHAVTVGDNTMTPQAAGAVQTAGSPTAPFVGVPCMPNAWTYVAAAQWNYIATDNAALLVFIIDDSS